METVKCGGRQRERALASDEKISQDSDHLSDRFAGDIGAEPVIVSDVWGHTLTRTAHL